MGYTVDDVSFVNGPASKPFELVIAGFVYDDSLKQAVITVITWPSVPRRDYPIEASNDLIKVTGIGNWFATGNATIHIN